MASSMLPFYPVVVQAAATSIDGQKSPKWWAPLFGFSSEPDYKNPGDKSMSAAAKGGSTPAKSRFATGSFTEKKAKQLRRMTCDASSFHETLYHSAIASRLASDFSDHIAA